jgi:hypothetical protein
MGSSRVKGRPGHEAEDQRPDESSTHLTPEERARLLAELEAEFEAAERSIREEGTITAEEFLKQRAQYWADLSTRSDSGKRGVRRRKSR